MIRRFLQWLGWRKIEPFKTHIILDDQGRAWMRIDNPKAHWNSKP